MANTAERVDTKILVDIFDRIKNGSQTTNPMRKRIAKLLSTDESLDPLVDIIIQYLYFDGTRPVCLNLLIKLSQIRRAAQLLIGKNVVNVICSRFVEANVVDANSLKILVTILKSPRFGVCTQEVGQRFSAYVLKQFAFCDGTDESLTDLLQLLAHSSDDLKMLPAVAKNMYYLIHLLSHSAVDNLTMKRDGLISSILLSYLKKARAFVNNPPAEISLADRIGTRDILLTQSVHLAPVMMRFLQNKSHENKTRSVLEELSMQILPELLYFVDGNFSLSESLESPDLWANLLSWMKSTEPSDFRHAVLRLVHWLSQSPKDRSFLQNRVSSKDFQAILLENGMLNAGDEVALLAVEILQVLIGVTSAGGDHDALSGFLVNALSTGAFLSVLENFFFKFRMGHFAVACNKDALAKLCQVDENSSSDTASPVADSNNPAISPRRVVISASGRADSVSLQLLGQLVLYPENWLPLSQHRDILMRKVTHHLQHGDMSAQLIAATILKSLTTNEHEFTGLDKEGKIMVRKLKNMDFVARAFECSDLKEEGFPGELFLANPVLHHYKCCVCFSYARNVHSCSKCGVPLCLYCAVQCGNKCPNKCVADGPLFAKNGVTNLAQRIMNDMEINCPMVCFHADFQCHELKASKKLSLSHFQEHVLEHHWSKLFRKDLNLREVKNIEALFPYLVPERNIQKGSAAAAPAAGAIDDSIRLRLELQRITCALLKYYSASDSCHLLLNLPFRLLQSLIGSDSYDERNLALQLLCLLLVYEPPSSRPDLKSYIQHIDETAVVQLLFYLADANKRVEAYTVSTLIPAALWTVAKDGRFRVIFTQPLTLTTLLNALLQPQTFFGEGLGHVCALFAEMLKIAQSNMSENVIVLEKEETTRLVERLIVLMALPDVPENRTIFTESTRIINMLSNSPQNSDVVINFGALDALRRLLVRQSSLRDVQNSSIILKTMCKLAVHGGYTRTSIAHQEHIDSVVLFLTICLSNTTDETQAQLPLLVSLLKFIVVALPAVDSAGFRYELTDLFKAIIGLLHRCARLEKVCSDNSESGQSLTLRTLRLLGQLNNRQLEHRYSSSYRSFVPLLVDIIHEKRGDKESECAAHILLQFAGQSDMFYISRMFDARAPSRTVDLRGQCHLARSILHAFPPDFHHPALRSVVTVLVEALLAITTEHGGDVCRAVILPPERDPTTPDNNISESKASAASPMPDMQDDQAATAALESAAHKDGYVSFARIGSALLMENIPADDEKSLRRLVLDLFLVILVADGDDTVREITNRLCSHFEIHRSLLHALKQVRLQTDHDIHTVESVVRCLVLLSEVEENLQILIQTEEIKMVLSILLMEPFVVEHTELKDKIKFYVDRINTSLAPSPKELVKNLKPRAVPFNKRWHRSNMKYLKKNAPILANIVKVVNNTADELFVGSALTPEEKLEQERRDSYLAMQIHLQSLRRKDMAKAQAMRNQKLRQANGVMTMESVLASPEPTLGSYGSQKHQQQQEKDNEEQQRADRLTKAAAVPPIEGVRINAPPSLLPQVVQPQVVQPQVVEAQAVEQEQEEEEADDTGGGDTSEPTSASAPKKKKKKPDFFTKLSRDVRRALK